MKRGRSESGVALVFMIMVWLVVLSAVALARSGLSAHGMRNVARLGLGGTAVEVARTALEEAFAVAQRRSNTPGDPMFMALRGEAAGERRWSVDTPAVRAALGSDAAWRDFELVSGQVELAQRGERRLADDPSARELRFELTARARHRPTGVVRELSTDRASQLRLLTVPRPFDSVSIVILDPGRLLEGVNDAMANALGEMSELTQVVLPQALASLEEKGRPDLAGRLRGLDLPPLPALDAPDSPYRFLPARPVLYSRDPLFPDLAGIDLAGTIARQREAIDANRGAYFAALNRLIDAGAGTERVEVLIDDWAASIQALHRANSGVIERVKSYTDRLSPIGEPATDVVRKQASALAEGPWRERATYRFEGPEAAQNFIRFLDRYEREPGGQGPSGIALVENRDGPVLSLTYSPDYTLAAHSFDTTRKSAWLNESIVASPIPGLETVTPEPLTVEQLLDVHSAEYVNAVHTGEPRRLAESQGFSWDPGLWNMVCASNGGAVAAALNAMNDGVAGPLSSGLQHARRDRGAGFCTFNGLALAARAALSAGARRVLVLDLDAHCGGGTWSILGADERAWQLDVSVSPVDHYTPTTRASLDLVGHAEAYLPTIERRLRGVQDEISSPDLVLYNAGMDPFEGCPIGGLSGITREVLAERERIVTRWCSGRSVPVAFVLAGGYLSGDADRDCLVALHRITIVAMVAR